MNTCKVGVLVASYWHPGLCRSVALVVHPQSALANEGYATIRSHPAHFQASHQKIGGLRSTDSLGATRRLRYRIALCPSCFCTHVHYERTSETKMSLHFTFSWIAYAHAPGNLLQ